MNLQDQIIENLEELISLRKKVRELEEENSSLRAFAEIHGVIKRKEVETANCYGYDRGVTLNTRKVKK